MYALRVKIGLILFASYEQLSVASHNDSNEVA